MSKKIVLFLFLIITSIGLQAQEDSALPVLRVTFDGKFKKGMDYVNGHMLLTDTDGKVIELPAKFKTRGATASSYMMKPSFNMKLRTSDYAEEVDTALLGMREGSSWILDAMAIDRICMRNRVAFEIWNEFSRLPYATEYDGRNGTEGRFVEVYINDQYYGIYCLSDRINRKLLNLRKTKVKKDGSTLIRGVLYKSGTSNIADQGHTGYNEDSTACVVSWHNAWELSYPDEYAGLAAWQPLLDAFEVGKTAEFVKKYFYLENLADYQIHVMALSIGDNWGNKNHFLSIRNIQNDIISADGTESDSRRFVITPWDLDTSLGGKYDGGYYDGTYSEWALNEMTKNALYPISSIGDDPEYKAILKRRWIEGRKGAFSTTSIDSKLDRYRDLFLKSGAWQRMVDYFEAQSSKPKYVKDLAREIELIKGWYRKRFHEMDVYFDTDDGVEDILMGDGQWTKDDESWYDLSGRHMTSPKKNGLYIRGRRKVVIQR